MYLATILAVTQLVLNIGVLNVVVALIIPLLVGLVTKLRASPGLKATINLFLSAIAGAIGTVIQADGALEVQSFVINILLTWGMSQISYDGLWKPTKIAEAIQNKTATTGLGKPAMEVETAPNG